MRWIEAAASSAYVVVAVVAAAIVHRQLPWIPPLYLGALIVTPFAARWITRCRALGRWWRWSGASLAVGAFIALLPVPWMKMQLDQPPGSAWRLDGRLVISDTTVDPRGEWYWLTAGRPPIVAEVIRSWFSDDDARPTNMHDGLRAHRPSISEPAAAAVGLRSAGWPIALGVTVEVSEPRVNGLPSRAVVAEVNGGDVTTRASWTTVAGSLGERNTITTAEGDTYDFAGSVLPFRRVDVIDTPRDDLDVTVGGRLARSMPGSWFRDLALGRSHGLMVALVSYVYASGDDLAAGRAIAGTGSIRGDGTVGPIAGLRAKATAARGVGAAVLLYPAAQQALLDGFEAGSMRLCAVQSLEEAIEALGTTRDDVESPAASTHAVRYRCR